MTRDEIAVRLLCAALSKGTYADQDALIRACIVTADATVRLLHVSPPPTWPKPIPTPSDGRPG